MVPNSFEETAPFTGEVNTSCPWTPKLTVHDKTGYRASSKLMRAGDCPKEKSVQSSMNTKGVFTV